MVQGFEQAQMDYERRMECPYDKGGALYEDDEYESESYWSNVDYQMEEYILGN